MLPFSFLRPQGIITLLLPLVLVTFVFDISRAEEDPHHIVFIRYNLKDKKPSAVMEGFKQTMKEKGYKEGETIIYTDYLIQKPEQKAAHDVLEFVEKYKENTDMFVTTSWTSVYVRSKLAKSKTPQLFAPALRSTVLSMLPSTDMEPQTNLTGVYLEFPPEKVLQLARRILPKLKRYAFVYDSRIPADITFKAAYGKLNENDRHGVTIYFLDLANGTDTVLQKINKMGIEAFGGGVGVLKYIKDLSKVNLPIITALLVDRKTPALIELIKNTGIIAGLFTPFDTCGKQAAIMAANILEGKAVIEKITPQPAQQLTVINLVAAKNLNQAIPFLAMEAADIVIK